MTKVVVVCDGCGRTVPREQKTADWPGVRALDETDGNYVDFDYCPECWKKMVEAVKK